jgi:hypothetical protein
VGTLEHRKVALALTLMPRCSPPRDALASRRFVTLSQAMAADRVAASGTHELPSSGSRTGREEVRDSADSCLLPARRPSLSDGRGNRNSSVYQGLLKITITAGTLRLRLHPNAIANAAQSTGLLAAGRTSFVCVGSRTPHLDGEA